MANKQSNKFVLLKNLQIIGGYGYDGVESSGKSSVQAFLKLVNSSTTDIAPDKRAYRELSRQQLISTTKTGESYRFTLTPNGAYRLMRNTIGTLVIHPPKEWDHKWRLVCFDIPKGKDKERQYLHKRLKELGFTLFKRSMWIHPFECFEVIRQITDHVNLTRYVSVIEVSKLDEKSTQDLLRKYEHLLHTQERKSSPSVI